MIICVLAAVIPALIFRFANSDLEIVGLILGAIAAIVAISATCGMSIKRSSIAAGIYLAVQIALSFVFSILLAKPA